MEPPPPPGGRDSRFNNNIGYNMNLLSGGGESPSLAEIYGRQSTTNLQQLSSPRHTMMVPGGCGGGGIRGGILSSNKSGDICYDERRGGMGLPPSSQQQDMQGSGGGGGSGSGSGGTLVDNVCGGVVDDDIHNDEPLYNLNQPSKKSPPNNGKKTKGRVKIKMEYIENKLRRYTTFSKRKTGIMKKAYELSTLTGTQVMLLVASETGHVYTFATRKLQPMITSEAGKALIQTCLNSPDPPAGSGAAGAPGGDQRMSATGFEETELTYNISDEDSKENIYNLSGVNGADIDDEDEDDEISDYDDREKNDDNLSGGETSDSCCSDTEMNESNETDSLSVFVTPDHEVFNTILSTSSSSNSDIKNNQKNNNNNSSLKNSSLSKSSVVLPPTSLSSSSSQVSLLSPLMYQTTQGLMYTTAAAPPSSSSSSSSSNGSSGGSGGVLLGLTTQSDPNTSQTQFITIPLSVVTTMANGGQSTELELTK